MTELQNCLWPKDLESSQTFILKKADARECTNYLIISLMSSVAHLSSEKLSNTWNEKCQMDRFQKRQRDMKGKIT